MAGPSNSRTGARTSAGGTHGLTLREQQVLKLIAGGASTREIAARLSLSTKTVEKHRGSLMRKVNLRGVAALTLYAVEHGYITVHRRY